MRLRFSRIADYAVRAALEIARVDGDHLVTRRALAEATDAPHAVLAQALAPLVRAELLVAQAGPRGGYRLARAPEAIAIYDIVRAVDGDAREGRCVLHERPCAVERACPFHPFLETAQEHFIAALQRASLADVVAAGSLADGAGASA